MTTVVDASVVVSWIAPDTAADDPALRLLTAFAERAEPLVGPGLLMAEVGNALLTGVRRQRWSGAAADSAFLHLRRLPLTVLDSGADVDRAYELSRRFDEHPIYDMVYVALAERIGAALVTADRRLVARLPALAFVVHLDDV